MTFNMRAHLTTTEPNIVICLKCEELVTILLHSHVECAPELVYIIG